MVSEVGEKITPDSQKSTLEQAKESATGTADNIAGMVQPGDSKSTSQKLSDETRSGGNDVADTLSSVGKNIQETASNLTQQASSNTGGAQDSGKTYLEQAQGIAVGALNTVSKAASGKISCPGEDCSVSCRTNACPDLANTIAAEKK